MKTTNTRYFLKFITNILLHTNIKKKEIDTDAIIMDSEV